VNIRPPNSVIGIANMKDLHSQTSAQIAGRGGHGRDLGGRDLERVHRTVREGAEPAVRIQEDAFGGIETERLFDGRTNLLRRLDLVGARVDDAQPDLLALEPDECAGPLRRDRAATPGRGQTADRADTGLRTGSWRRR
jgi:hypothetical protein